VSSAMKMAVSMTRAMFVSWKDMWVMCAKGAMLIVLALMRASVAMCRMMRPMRLRMSGKVVVMSDGMPCLACWMCAGW
jgi:hypothetical protein